MRSKRIGQGPYAESNTLAYKEGLAKRLQAITYAGSTDGCSTVINAVQQLKNDGLLPNLRYQFRDRPHTTRTIIRLVFKVMLEGAKLREVLITGKKSFAKRACYSKRFALIWRLVQKEDPADIFNVFANLSYKEHRYDNRSGPMMTFCLKLGAIVKVLLILANDRLEAHRKDQVWACTVLGLLQGQDGFDRLLYFTIDADYAFATTMLTRLQD